MTELQPRTAPMPRERDRLTSVPQRRQPDVATEVARIVGSNLREARRRHGLSLDTLAHASGVSRAMLGQIETAKSVPTITLLWKVAEALGVPVAQLITRADMAPYIVEPRAAANVVVSGAGQATTRMLKRPEQEPGVEFLEMRTQPGHRELVAARRTSANISLIVAQGCIEAEIDGSPPIRLEAGDAIFFGATSEHVLGNIGNEESVLYLVVEPRVQRRT